MLKFVVNLRSFTWVSVILPPTLVNIINCIQLAPLTSLLNFQYLPLIRFIWYRHAGPLATYSSDACSTISLQLLSFFWIISSSLPTFVIAPADILVVCSSLPPHPPPTSPKYSLYPLVRLIFCFPRGYFTSCLLYSPPYSTSLVQIWSSGS